MATRLVLFLGSLGAVTYCAIVAFDAADKSTKKLLIEKNYGSMSNDDTKQKMLLMAALKQSAYGNEAIKRDDTEKFQMMFSERQSNIESKLAISPNIPQDLLKNHFIELNGDLHSLQKLYSSSSPYLRIYYRKIYQEALQGLQNKIQESEAKLLPRKKFVFKGSRTKNKIESVLVQNNIDLKNDKFKKETENNDGPNSCQYRNRSNETIHIDAAVAGKAVLLSEMHNCTVEIKGAASTIHIAHVTDCNISSGPVTTSVFVEAANSSNFQLACQQLRIHESNNSRFSIHVTSKAIIEDCRNLKFGIYQFWYPEIDNDYKISGLNKDVNNWKEVDDFNWLVAGKPSPNWTLLES